MSHPSFATEIIAVARGFRRGLLGGKSPKNECFKVCFPLHALLLAMGEDCELVNGWVKRRWNHYWLRLPNGYILDPTASQFTWPGGGKMPTVYCGPLPPFYQEGEQQ